MRTNFAVPGYPPLLPCHIYCAVSTVEERISLSSMTIIGRGHLPANSDVA